MQFFKSLLAYLLIVCCCFFSIKDSKASNVHLILGGDYVTSDIKDKKIKDQDYTLPKGNFKSFSPVIGLTAYGIGLEAYILNSKAIKEDSLEAKIRAYGFDIFGEANLSDDFSVIASLGLSEYKFSIKQDDKKFSDDANGPRFGIGLQYHISRNLAIIGMYHYTLLNSGSKDIYDAISEFSAGVRLIF